MSLWWCPEHGMTGPGVCCGRGARAEVEPMGKWEEQAPGPGVADVVRIYEQARQPDLSARLYGLAAALEYAIGHLNGSGDKDNQALADYLEEQLNRNAPFAKETP